jgi:hypothetical protein
MGLRDVPFWTRMAAQMADAGLDRMGAKRCARKGHKWRDIPALVVGQDGSVTELPRGSAQRCVRCGAEREMGIGLADVEETPGA